MSHRSVHLTCTMPSIITTHLNNFCPAGFYRARLWSGPHELSKYLENYYGFRQINIRIS